MNLNSPLFFLTALYSLLLLNNFTAVGYHPDSLVYMSMARNLAEGEGSFWHLIFTPEYFNGFYEHPPFGILCMALPFFLFGDTVLVDKLFGFFLGILILIIINKLWKLMTPKAEHTQSWVALFYFIVFPLTLFTLHNNLLEGIATLYILLAVYFSLKVLHKGKNIWLYGALYAISMITAFLTKGLVTLFPLILPPLYLIIFGGNKKHILLFMFYSSLLMFLGAVALMFNENAANYLDTYLHKQVLGTLSGNRGESNHLTVTLQLLLDNTLIVGISVVLLLLGRSPLPTFKYNPLFLFFFILALSGSLPLELSPYQSHYYIFPSLPFYALAFGFVFAQKLEERAICYRPYRFFVILGGILFSVLVALLIVNDNRAQRQQNFFQDIGKNNKRLKLYSKVYGCASGKEAYAELFYNTELTGSFQRYYHSYITKDNNAPFLVTIKDHKKGCDVNWDAYHYIGLSQASHFLLYERN